VEKTLNVGVRVIAANLQHVLVKKPENSAQNTATRIMQSAHGVKQKNNYKLVCEWKIPIKC